MGCLKCDCPLTFELRSMCYDRAFGALPKDLQRECVSLPDEAAPQ